MDKPSPIYAAERFTSLIEELCRVLTKHGRARFVDASLLLLIWNRLMRLARRFEKLAQRVVAGTLSVRRTPSGSRGSGRAAAGEMLPGHFRWLVNMIPEAEARGGDLCWLLQRLEMQEMIFAAPEVGRILRPLCRMLGVEPTFELRQPMRARPAAKTTEPMLEHQLDDDGEPYPELDAEFWRLHPPPKLK